MSAGSFAYDDTGISDLFFGILLVSAKHKSGYSSLFSCSPISTSGSFEVLVALVLRDQFVG